MSGEEWDRDVEELARLSAEAAPHAAAGAHATDDELAKMRADADGEATDLDAIYRHVASCAACRARLIEPAPALIERAALALRVEPGDEAALLDAASRAGLTPIARGPHRFVLVLPPDDVERAVIALRAVPHQAGRSRAMPLIAEGATAPIELEAFAALSDRAAATGPMRARARVVPLPPRRNTVFAWASAAALLLLAGAGALYVSHSAEAPLAIEQRAFAGLMGRDGSAGTVAPEDLDVEITVRAPAGIDAVMVLVDRGGAPLLPPRPFAHGADGRLHLVVAPRTFARHPGEAFGIVVAGDATGVRETIADAAAAAPATSVDAEESLLRAHARAHNARVQRITIDAR